MTTTGIVIAAVLGAVMLAAMTLWAKPRFDRVAARREEIGDVDLPSRRQAKLLAIAIPGSAAVVAIPLIWNTDAGLIVGVVLLCALYWLIIAVSLQEAEAAQRDATR